LNFFMLPQKHGSLRPGLRAAAATGRRSSDALTDCTVIGRPPTAVCNCRMRNCLKPHPKGFAFRSFLASEQGSSRATVSTRKALSF
jgi:hypothetical protein